MIRNLHKISFVMLAAMSSVCATAQTAERATAVVEPAIAVAAPCHSGALSRCNVVADKRLASMRGGYDVGNGLQVSFGIERMSYINGQLVTQSRLTVPDVSKISGSQAAGLAGMNALGLIQTGQGNSVRIEQPQFAATVIQNSLDNQSIRNLTVVDVSSNSLQLLRNANLQGALRDVLTLPLAVH